MFVDTSAYYALTDAGESRHVDAKALIGQFVTVNVRLFTTNFVLAETHALLLHRVGRVLARLVLDEILRSSTTTVRISARDEAAGWTIIQRYHDKDFSFTDATSFAVMDRLHITHAFTFDSDFVSYGVPCLPSPRL